MERIFLLLCTLLEIWPFELFGRLWYIFCSHSWKGGSNFMVETSFSFIFRPQPKTFRSLIEINTILKSPDGDWNFYKKDVLLSFSGFDEGRNLYCHFSLGLGKLLTLCESQNLTNAKDAQVASIMGKIKYSRIKNDHITHLCRKSSKMRGKKIREPLIKSTMQNLEFTRFFLPKFPTWDYSPHICRNNSLHGNECK